MATLLAVAWLAAALLGPGAPPAAAHGAPDNPLSRTLACAPEGAHVASAVCQAALAASGRAGFEDWDYLRVAGVQGRDREVIPDGALCSGGIDQFAGLDLARDDWPVTELPAGAELTFTYRTTIPHQGTFRLYVTRDGYDPTAPLTWSALEAEPFLTVTDPELVGETYQLPGQTPSDKSGRHIVFTIWQNSDTPDTYYSCSDVLFAAPAGPATGAGAAATTAPSPPATPATPDSAPVSPAAGGTAPGTPAGAVALVIAGTAAVALALALAAVALLQHRRHRARAAAGSRVRGGSHRHRPGR